MREKDAAAAINTALQNCTLVEMQRSGGLFYVCPHCTFGIKFGELSWTQGEVPRPNKESLRQAAQKHVEVCDGKPEVEQVRQVWGQRRGGGLMRCCLSSDGS